MDGWMDWIGVFFSSFLPEKETWGRPFAQKKKRKTKKKRGCGLPFGRYL